MTRGLVAWGLLWLIMIPTIFIPVVHFVSVPALLLAGPIAGRMIYKMYNGKSDVKTSGAICPNCQESLFLPGSRENWPVNNVCVKCKTSYSATIVG
jgi:ribosomal protein S27AE